jgi:putative transposase
MPRPPRIDFHEARHHVMNRGAGRNLVFVRDDDCLGFLGLLGELPARFRVLVHGYALMPNHFHLMLESCDGRLSVAMAFLLGRYTQRFNRAHGTDGPRFRGRFHSRLVLREDHWMHLLAYLHLNPVRARLASRADRAHWTSHGAYAGTETAPEWLTHRPLLDAFGGTKAYEAYVRDVRKGGKRRPDEFDRVMFDAGAPPIAAPERGAPSPARACEADLGLAARALGVTVPHLRRKSPGRRGNRERAAVAWWLVMERGASAAEVSRALGMDPSRVSKVVAALRGKRGRVADMERLLKRLADQKGPLVQS